MPGAGLFIDRQAVEAFEALLKIQDIGDDTTKANRKRSIVEIKSILLSTIFFMIDIKIILLLIAMKY